MVPALVHQVVQYVPRISAKGEIPCGENYNRSGEIDLQATDLIQYFCVQLSSRNSRAKGGGGPLLPPILGGIRINGLWMSKPRDFINSLCPLNNPVQHLQLHCHHLHHQLHPHLEVARPGPHSS
jgi:hypothetical protein